MKTNRGQTLIVVLGIMVTFMIFIAGMVRLIQNEARWTTKQKKTSTAFQAAEAGVEQGLWKLKESTANWDTVKNGGSLPGFTGMTEYDLASSAASTPKLGQYKVDLFDGPVPGQVTLRSIGRDLSTNEIRAVEVILTKTVINSSLSVDNALDWKPGMDVQWGPVVCYSSIDNSSSLPKHPRKYAKGAIGDDTSPTPPNSGDAAGKEHWFSFQNLGNAPKVDLNAYVDLAKGCTINYTLLGLPSSTVAYSSPTGSGYLNLPGGTDIVFDNVYQDTAAVIYVANGNVRLSNNSFTNVKALIVDKSPNNAGGDVTFKAKAYSYTATVPPSAAAEYAAEDASYNWPGKGATTHVINNCGMHGFLYCARNFDTAGGNAIICGVAKIAGSMSFNTFTVYYDNNVAANIRLTDSPILQLSWREVNADW